VGSKNSRGIARNSSNKKKTGDAAERKNWLKTSGVALHPPREITLYRAYKFSGRKKQLFPPFRL
jgi:hypothetical protein